MKPKLLMIPPLGQIAEETLSKRFDVSYDTTPRSDIQALVTIGTFTTDAALMDSFPGLKIIACFGSGYEGIDLAAARARNIKVTNTVGANASAVADLAVALLLASMRHLIYGDQLVRKGEWRGKDSSRLLLTPGITGRRIGIIGLGAIGRKIGERMAAFETEIGYYNRSKKDDVDWTSFNSPLELAKWADALILSHRANETNRHMINTEVLNALGPKGHIVNISRGSAIDEDALIAALDERRIAGAALDVFEGEPDVRPELVNSPYTVLTPHIGGGSRESIIAMSDAVEANVSAFFDGMPLPSELK